MKYMTFNSSCSYAGVANMLEQYGVDTDDRSIALGMKLPYMFSYEDGVYMAGPMLQSAEWFNLYLHPIGFDMHEIEVPATEVPAYLKRHKVAMLGLQVDDSGKHAVVYTGSQDDLLVFINNKWEHTDVPELIKLSETELIAQIGSSVMIATLEPIPSQATDLSTRLSNSVPIIRQNLSEIQELCSREETVALLRSKLNTVFRPLLLDGITMLGLLGKDKLASRFTEIQRLFLNVLRQNAATIVRLADYLPVDKLTAAAEEYILLIQSA